MKGINWYGALGAGIVTAGISVGLCAWILFAWWLSVSLSAWIPELVTFTAVIILPFVAGGVLQKAKERVS